MDGDGGVGRRGGGREEARPNCKNHNIQASNIPRIIDSVGQHSAGGRADHIHIGAHWRLKRRWHPTCPFAWPGRPQSQPSHASGPPRPHPRRLRSRWRGQARPAPGRRCHPPMFAQETVTAVFRGNEAGGGASNRQCNVTLTTCRIRKSDSATCMKAL